MEETTPCRRGLKGGEEVEESSKAAERDSTGLDWKDSTRLNTGHGQGLQRGLSWVSWASIPPTDAHRPQGPRTTCYRS